jgi:homoserine dehydrogenase
LRLTIENVSGVLAKVTQVFAKHSISIDAMIQKETHVDDDLADIILVTSSMLEKEMNKIINEIEMLPESKDKVVKLRVEQLNK